MGRRPLTPVVGAAFVLAFGLLLTAGTATWFATHDARTVQSRLDLVASDIDTRVVGRLDATTAALRTIATGVGTGALTDAEIRTLLEEADLATAPSGVEAVTWVPADGEASAAPRNAPEAREAISTARDTATTAVVPTVGEEPPAPLVVAVPAHRGEVATLDARRADYLGAVVATIAPGAFFDDLADLPLRASMQDRGPMAQPPTDPRPLWATSTPPPTGAATYDLALGDRRLELALAPGPGFPAGDHTVGLVTLTGTLLSFLLAGLLIVLVGRRRRLEVEVAQRTRELQQANEALQQAGALRTQFITTVSHELRTPLTSVLGFVQTVRRIEELEPQVRDDFLERAERNGLTLRRMIEELLDFGRLERGELELTRQVVDVGATVTRMAADLRPAVGARPIDVDVEPGIRAEVDLSALHRILANLLSNAATYATGDHPVELHVRRRDHFVEIVCADRGPGFDPADMPRLLERFVRGAGVMGQGTGLGLAVVRELALAHGGDARLRNREGGGAEVVVGIPGVHTSIAPTTGTFAPGLARVD